MAAKIHERALYQSFDKRRFLEFRPVDVSREGGGTRETSERNILGTFLFSSVQFIYFTNSKIYNVIYNQNILHSIENITHTQEKY